MECVDKVAVGSATANTADGKEELTKTRVGKTGGMCGNLRPRIILVVRNDESMKRFGNEN